MTPRVLFAAAEMTPFAKVGGLADVAGSLPKALAASGISITVLFPKYAVIDEKRWGLARSGKTLRATIGERVFDFSLWRARLPGSDVPVVLIDHPDWIGNGGVYAEPDASSGGSNPELQRFGLFSAAVAAYAAQQHDASLLHCHDWHVAAAVPLLKKLYGRDDIRTLLTIHNLAYQGVYPLAFVDQDFGAAYREALPPEARIGERKELANFLLAGILTTDWVSTVSPSYRDEILTPEEGAGLDRALLARRDRFVGILNGIDTEAWNPAKDPLIPKRYDARTLRAKRQNKTALQRSVGLPEDADTFLCGMVSRLTEQKGFDIVLPALPEALESAGLQLVFLATGDPNYAKALTELAQRHPNRLVFINRFDEKLAHEIYAGSDAFLMPSRFEPCGLGQMISMRYGTLPIARATGGLKDTVVDAGRENGAGFVFEPYTADALRDTIRRAETLFRNDPARWRKLQENAMARDWSWAASAKQYLALYEKILGRA